MTRFKIRYAAIVLLVVAAPGMTVAKPLNYAIPDDTTELKAGPARDIAQNNCTACHSIDYIGTQPKGPKFTQDFWRAEVTKMIKVYGAPIDDADAAKIVDYLTATY